MSKQLPKYSWRFTVRATRLRIMEHDYDSVQFGKLHWWAGHAIGPQGMVSVYAQNEKDGTAYAQFRIVRNGREYCYRRTWNVPLMNTRPLALAAGQVLRGEVA